MANYKVIQDIEAEDKLVGPLTLRQFIYAAIASLLAYLSFWAITKGLSLGLVVLVPPMIFTGFFAFPWGRDQSTEIWALAKIRYYLKSRRRLWDQTGVEDLVTVTAPKHEATHLTNGLSQTEVQSRLSALANTLDTRGWAVKNVSTIPPLVGQGTSDRLIDINNLPREVPTTGLTAADDILDEDNNPRAQQLSQMVATATASHKQQLLDGMRSGTLPEPKGDASQRWFMQSPPVTNRPTTDAQLDATLHEHQAEAGESTEHLKTIEPLRPQPVKPTASQPAVVVTQPPKPPVTSVTNPATIQRLAYNDDLDIATIARQANKENGSDEVVISLHRRK